MKKKTQELINRAYQVLIDKIDVKNFEEFIYELVEENELKTKSLLYDLIDINYRSKKYKKELSKLIEKAISEEERISLEIYKKYLAIQNSKGKEEIYILWGGLWELHWDYTSNEIFEDMYTISEEKMDFMSGYGNLTEVELIQKIKVYSLKILEWFYRCRKEEDWRIFLHGEEKEILVESEKIENLEKEPVSFFTTTLDIIKGILGIR